MNRIAPHVDFVEGGRAGGAMKKMVGRVALGTTFRTGVVNGTPDENIEGFQRSAETRPKLAERGAPRTGKQSHRLMDRRRARSEDTVRLSIKLRDGHRHGSGVQVLNSLLIVVGRHNAVTQKRSDRSTVPRRKRMTEKTRA